MPDYAVGDIEHGSVFITKWDKPRDGLSKLSVQGQNFHSFSIHQLPRLYHEFSSTVFKIQSELFSCDQCEKSFQSQHGLKIHTTRMHITNKSSQCSSSKTVTIEHSQPVSEILELTLLDVPGYADLLDIPDDDV